MRRIFTPALLLIIGTLGSCQSEQTTATTKESIETTPPPPPPAISFAALNSCYTAMDLSTDSLASTPTPDAVKEQMTTDIRQLAAKTAGRNATSQLKALAAGNGLTILSLKIDSVTNAYVLHMDDSVLGNTYNVYLANNKGTVSAKPFIFTGDHLQNNEEDIHKKYHLLTRPYFYLTDMDSNGRKELVFKESIHQGAEYNAVREHHITYDEALNPVEMFQLETVAFLPLDSTEKRITRTISYNRKSSLYKISSYFTEKKKKKEAVPAGEMVLSLKDGKWRVISKKFSDIDYRDLLLTCNPEGEAMLVQ